MKTKRYVFENIYNAKNDFTNTIFFVFRSNFTHGFVGKISVNNLFDTYPISNQYSSVSFPSSLHRYWLMVFPLPSLSTVKLPYTSGVLGAMLLCLKLRWKKRLRSHFAQSGRGSGGDFMSEAGTFLRSKRSSGKYTWYFPLYRPNTWAG